MKTELPVHTCSLSEDDIDIPQIRVGRPRKWENPEEFGAAVNAWLKKRKLNTTWKYYRSKGFVQIPDPRPLTIASLCHHLEINPRTFYRWRKDANHPLNEMCDQILVTIEEDLWDQNTASARLNLASNFVRSQRARA